MEKSPLISVIVPVYNVERYIGRCIESIQRQTYSNLEIILVDDGSADGSRNVCETYAESDSRIKVLHKSNSGPSDTRNMALDCCNGDFIAFVDSDDWISEYYISNLFNAIQKDDSDLAMSWFENVVDGDVAKAKPTDGLEGYEVIDTEECFRRLLYMNGVDTSACSRLYRHSAITPEVRFPSGKLYEDIIFSMYTIGNSSKIAIVKNVDYFYFQLKSSIQYRKFNSRKMDIMVHMEMLKDYVLTRYPELHKAMSCRLVSAASNMLFQLQGPKENPKEFGILWSAIKTNRRTVLFDGNARKKARIASLLSFFGYRVMKKVYSLTQMRG